MPMYRLVVKLKALKRALKGLNKARFSDVENEAKRAANALKIIQAQIHDRPHDTDLHTQEKVVRGNYDKLHKARLSF